MCVFTRAAIGFQRLQFRLKICGMLVWNTTDVYLCSSAVMVCMYLFMLLMLLVSHVFFFCEI